MYGEESDLCRRARAIGAQPRMTPEATIIHYAGQSSRKRSDKEILVFKAKATMIRRHFPAWQQPLARFLLGLWPWSRMASGDLLARLTGRRRFAEAAAHWQAVWERAGELAARAFPAAAPPEGRGLPPEAGAWLGGRRARSSARRPRSGCRAATGAARLARDRGQRLLRQTPLVALEELDLGIAEVRHDLLPDQPDRLRAGSRPRRTRRTSPGSCGSRASPRSSSRCRRTGSARRG